MALNTSKLAAATAVAAAFSLLAAPVGAAELPVPDTAQAYDGDGLDAERHRRWGRGNGIDASDVIAGVLVLGTIAAVAGAARERRERYPFPYPRDEDARYRTPGGYDRYESRGIDRAVDMCVAEVERGADRVGTVDAATRHGDGWRVSGELESGASYSCTIGNDGRISDVDVGGYGAGAGWDEDASWDDEYYIRAREARTSTDPYPYPGDDDRYDTAEGPDFE